MGLPAETRTKARTASPTPLVSRPPVPPLDRSVGLGRPKPAIRGARVERVRPVVRGARSAARFSAEGVLPLGGSRRPVPRRSCEGSTPRGPTGALPLSGGAWTAEPPGSGCRAATHGTCTCRLRAACSERLRTFVAPGGRLNVAQRSRPRSSGVASVFRCTWPRIQHGPSIDSWRAQSHPGAAVSFCA